MGLLGSIGKALFGGKKKKAETVAHGTTATTQDPWAPAVPYLTDYLKNTDALYKNTPLFSEQEQTGYDNLFRDAEMARGGNEAAIAENNKTLSGAYLTPDTNPYLADIAKRVSGLAGANNSVTFGGRGRTGGGLAGYYGGKAVTDSLTDLYGGAYENERGRMSSAVGMAPSLVSSSLVPASAEVAAGQQISNRPFERNAMQGGLFGAIGGLGQQGTGVVDSTEKVYGRSSGLLGSIFNSAMNKAFGTTFGTN